MLLCVWHMGYQLCNILEHNRTLWIAADPLPRVRRSVVISLLVVQPALTKCSTWNEIFGGRQNWKALIADCQTSVEIYSEQISQPTFRNDVLCRRRANTNSRVSIPIYNIPLICEHSKLILEYHRSQRQDHDDGQNCILKLGAFLNVAIPMRKIDQKLP